MDRKRVKFILLAVGVVVSMGFLMVVGMNRPGGFAYYLTVSEFTQTPDRGSDGFRVNGKVAEGSILRDSSGQEVRFIVSDGAAELPVHYSGIIPDTFVDGADVVVEGRLGDDGTFEAHLLLAKCPSKYESADDAESSASVIEIPSGS